MQLKIQKRLAARILKASQNDIWLDSGRLDEIKEAITKVDIKSLIKDKAIKPKKRKGISRYRIRRKKEQKSKGGFFRSKRHIKVYMQEHKIGK